MLTAVAMLGFGGPAWPGAIGAVVPQGLWHLKVCSQVSFTRPRCAYLDQTRRLRVRNGSADEDKVLFDDAISADVTQQVLDAAVAVIRSFAPPSASGVDVTNLTVQLSVNGDSAEVHVSALSSSYKAGPGGRDLVKLLRHITHAF
jgi:hypothetical protein